MGRARLHEVNQQALMKHNESQTEDSSACGGAGGGGGVHVLEHEALRGQPVEVGRLDVGVAGGPNSVEAELTCVRAAMLV